MIINNHYINASLTEILEKLRQQMIIDNRVYLRGKIIDGPENIMIQCPYHGGGQERKPSMGIKKSDGVCHCFSCDHVVSLHELISNVLGYDDYGNAGWQWLLRNFGIVEQEEREDVKLDFGRRNSFSTLGNSVNDMVAVMGNTHTTDRNQERTREDWEEELDRYRVIHPYMKERGLTDDIIGIFDIGFDSETSCITFPIKDVSGNVLFIGRRSVSSKYYTYPAKVKKPVYGLYEVLSSLRDNHYLGSKVYITEGPFDMWRAWTYGCLAVSLLGLGTNYQFQQLLEFPVRHYVLATDMDEAGMKARERIKKH